MKEQLNAHKPLTLNPKDIFADVNGSKGFAYNYIGRLLAGLNSNQDSLSRLHKLPETDNSISPDFMAHEEKRHEERWQEASKILSLVLKVPVGEIDKKELLIQFNILSHQRVNELSEIGNRKRENIISKFGRVIDKIHKIVTIK